MKISSSRSKTMVKTGQYFLNNCHVVKTEDLSWSEGNGILVQTKELGSSGYHPSELAFPYSKLQLPKYGKRNYL